MGGVGGRKGIWQWLWLSALGGKFEHQDSQERLQPPDTELRDLVKIRIVLWEPALHST